MIERLRYHLAWERAYRRLPQPKTREELVLDEAAVLAALEAGPIPIERRSFDVEAYRRWLERADYAKHAPGYYEHNLHEKSLEHFTTATLLGFENEGEGDGVVANDNDRARRVIDVAAQVPVAADLFSRLYGVESFVQDLDFPDGVHGREIGGDAAAMPVDEGFADALTLHCSFEHFEGDADQRFIGEVARVLRPGGRCVIAPLYLLQHFAALTNPVLSAPPRSRKSDGGRARDLEPAQVEFNEGALLHASKSWHNRHGRFYSVEQLVERVWNRRGELAMKVVVFDNCRDIDPSCYLRYALVIDRPQT